MKHELHAGFSVSSIPSEPVSCYDPAMGDIAGIHWAAAVVLSFGLLAAVPVVIVNMLQNRRRRLYTREIGERFGLEVDPDSSSRIKRAQPVARGITGRLFADVRPGISRSGYVKVSNRGFFRTDLCLVTVFASPPGAPFLLRSRFSAAADSDEFSRAFTAEALQGGKAPELSAVTEQMLLAFRKRYAKAFEIAWRADGHIESATSPLLSRKTADAVAELLRVMLHMGEEAL